MDGIVEAKKAAPTRDEPKRLQFFLDWTQNWTQLRNLLRSPPLLSRCYLNRPGRNRTCNPRFWRPVLYQLSYGPRNRRRRKLQNSGCRWKARWFRGVIRQPVGGRHVEDAPERRGPRSCYGRRRKTGRRGQRRQPR